jgi:cellulose 1,4-beta-cellobiosidase
VELRSSDPQPGDNHLRPHLRIRNSGPAVRLSELRVRYWYSEPSNAAQQAHCDWAQVGCGNLLLRFGTVSPARTGANRYLEVGFGTGAPTLASGGTTGELQLRANKTDWSNYAEADDYSYLPGGPFARTGRVTVYRNGRLVWGTEPR